MRKDVRLGLAVGAILFVVVLTYVIFFTGGSRDNDPQGNGPQAGVPATQESHAAAPLTPESSPLISQTPGGDPSIVIGHGPAVGEAPAPTSEEPAASAGGRIDWNYRLSHGDSSVIHSVTPGATGTVDTPPMTVEPMPPAPMTVIPTPPVGESAGPKRYVVKPGETYWSIAKNEYGSPGYYPHLVRANPNISASRLRAGMTINVPDKAQVIPAGSAALASAQGPTTRPLDANTEYRVQSGDSLYSIAKKLYGRGDRSGRLYELNKELIRPNPSALKLNMVLRLPEPPVVAGSLAGPLP